MKRKGTDMELPADEAFSADPSSEDDSDSDEDNTSYNPISWSLDNNNSIMASPTPPSTHSPLRPSRQAARKASATIASYNEDLPGGIMDKADLLSEALRPMKSEDKDEHKAWVEMESDPVSPTSYQPPSNSHVY